MEIDTFISETVSKMADADAELIVNGHSFGSWSGFRSNIDVPRRLFIPALQ